MVAARNWGKFLAFPGEIVLDNQEDYVGILENAFYARAEQGSDDLQWLIVDIGPASVFVPAAGAQADIRGPGESAHRVAFGVDLIRSAPRSDRPHSAPDSTLEAALYDHYFPRNE